MPIAIPPAPTFWNSGAPKTSNEAAARLFILITLGTILVFLMSPREFAPSLLIPLPIRTKVLAPLGIIFSYTSNGLSATANAKHALFLTWLNATTTTCCAMPIPPSISLVTSPAITHPLSHVHYDTAVTHAKSVLSPAGTGRSVFEKLYKAIVVNPTRSLSSLFGYNDPLANSRTVITSGAVRGVYYDAATADPTATPPTLKRPILVIPPQAHVTRTVALKSLYSGALNYLTPGAAKGELNPLFIEVGKTLSYYPPQTIPSIPGRITGSSHPSRHTVTSAKLSRSLVLANLSPSLSMLSDEVILGLFLARERFLGSESWFAPWVMNFPGAERVDKPVDFTDIVRRVGRMENSDKTPAVAAVLLEQEGPPSYCAYDSGGRHFRQVRERGGLFDDEGWQEERANAREYSRNIATSLAKDYGWIVTAKGWEAEVLSSKDVWGESNVMQRWVLMVKDMFDIAFVSKKERDLREKEKNHVLKMGTSAGNAGNKQNSARRKGQYAVTTSDAHHDNPYQKYKVVEPVLDVKVAELIDWGICMAVSRGISGSRSVHVNDVYFPQSTSEMDEGADPQAVFMKQVEELIENEYRFIDQRAKDLAGANTAAKGKKEKANTGTIKLVPLLDFVNHGGTTSIVEETTPGSASLGTFKVFLDEHTLEDGKGEITANYNIDGYSGLDWYLAQGFVPLERAGRWDKGKNIMDGTVSAGPKAGDGGGKEREASEKWRLQRGKK